MLEMEPYRKPREEWCRKSAQRRDVAGKSQQTLYLGEAIKGRRESRDLKNSGDHHSLDH